MPRHRNPASWLLLSLLIVAIILAAITLVLAFRAGGGT